MLGLPGDPTSDICGCVARPIGSASAGSISLRSLARPRVRQMGKSWIAALPVTVSTPLALGLHDARLQQPCRPGWWLLKLVGGARRPFLESAQQRDAGVAVGSALGGGPALALSSVFFKT